jgi:hypothetical protein
MRGANSLLFFSRARAKKTGAAEAAPAKDNRHE